MHLLTCEHPIRVYNRHIDEYVWTSCGKCATCRKARSSRWVSRLEQERKNHLFSLFVTLTYDESNVPMLHALPSETLYDYKRDLCIPFSDLTFKSEADKCLFYDLCNSGGIRYASVTDLQKFHKRLNKYFHDHVTKQYKNFRYFAVSEYGSTSLRPHFHCLYFVDESEVCSQFMQGVASCWPYGNCDTEIITSTASAYVAQYLNECFNLPSFFENRKLRPFFVFSKRPSIGAVNECTEDDKALFDKCSVTRDVVNSKDGSVTSVSNFTSVENRVFPKPPFYRFLSNSLKSSVLGCASLPYQRHLSLHSFKDWLSCLIGYLSLRPHQSHETDLYRYLSMIADRFSPKGIERLRRLYYMSKRVLLRCSEWHISLNDYVRKIDEYYSKKELHLLREFYRFQELYSSSHSSDELAYMYPEFMYQVYGDDTSSYCVSLKDCYDYKIMLQDSVSYESKMTKSHFKNAYFQSKLEQGDLLFNILNKYYNAKKCNETFEARGKLSA